MSFSVLELTLITLASVSAPLHVRLHPVKFTVITDVLFFIALQRTAEKEIHANESQLINTKSKKKNYFMTKITFCHLLSTPLSPIWQNSRDKCCRVLFLLIPYKEQGHN